MSVRDNFDHIMSAALGRVLKKYGVNRKLEVGANNIDFGNPFSDSDVLAEAMNDNDSVEPEDSLNILVDLFLKSPSIIRELGKNFTDLVRQQRAPKIDTGDIVDRFQRFLIGDGLNEAEAQEMASRLGGFVSREMPELSVLGAVDALRKQHRAEELVFPEKKYVARRKDELVAKNIPDELYPFAFLEYYYGDAVREGRLSAGRLQEIDHALYQALWSALKDEGKGRTVRDLLNPLARDYLGRAEACAAILGIESPEEAGRFFGMRPARIAAAQRGGR